MYQFPCPRCGTRLRAKDRSFRGRTVHCPDCHNRLRIEESADGLVAAIVESDAAFADGQVETGSDGGGRSGTNNKGPKSTRWTARITFAFLLLLLSVLFAGVLWWALWPGKRDPVLPPSHVAGKDSGDEGPQPGTSQSKGPAQVNPLSGAERRLQVIGRELAAYAGRHGAWPAADRASGLALADHFSWIAIIEAARNESLHPDWQRAWHDPVNERFVRRRMDSMLNPSVSLQTGADRYPATHFVGVAGVGNDGPRLPKEHPRAGIFGYGRAARAEDVSDGLSNTMLVAGVSSELGSWAAAGRSTIRPFAMEPYVNGPDGFGTGQPDGMYVLMADGSVREISSKTAPVVVRRMAAMSDGFALDSKGTGDPLNSPVPTVLAQGEAKASAPTLQDPADLPLDVPVAPDLLFPSLDKSLAQSVIAFDQPHPVALRTMLQQMEEMLGIPIDMSAMTAGQLDQTVTLHQEQTSMGAILQGLLDGAGLTFHADPLRGIIIAPSRAEQGEGERADKYEK